MNVAQLIAELQRHPPARDVAIVFAADARRIDNEAAELDAFRFDVDDVKNGGDCVEIIVR